MDNSLMGEERVFLCFGPDRTKRLVIRHVTAAAMIGRRADLEGGKKNLTTHDGSWNPHPFVSGKNWVGHTRSHHKILPDLAEKKGPYDNWQNQVFPMFFSYFVHQTFLLFHSKRKGDIDSWNPLGKIAPWQHGFSIPDRTNENSFCLKMDVSKWFFGPKKWTCKNW